YATSRYLFGFDLLLALFVGGTLTATSIGVTVRILRDVNRQNSREGQIVLGAAVIDDILGVLLLALLYEFSQTGDLSAANLLRLVLFIGVFFALAPLAAKLISTLIGHYHRASQMPGLVATLIVSLVMVFAWLAHIVGAPELLGGFTAGLALSRRFFLPFGAALQADPEFSSHVHEQMKPIIQLFTPIFFATVGLSLDLSSVDWGSLFFWIFSISLAAVAVATKILGALLLREPLARRVVIGMSMVPRGEVGLVFAELGRQTGLLDQQVFAIVVIVIAYTTLFTPFWLRLFYRRCGHLLAD
ncbi:MAG TPA: cation:proton antiporter, partial [Gammaproteobacteria bacterium]